MSKQIGKLYHPTNKEPSDIFEGFNWPCLFVGPLWFAVKGMWMWTVGSVLLASFTCGLSWFIFPFFANRMYKKHLRSSGWLAENQANGNNINQVHPALIPTNTPQYQGVSNIPNADISVRSATTINYEQPQQSAIQSISSKSFVLAKLDDGISWKNEYDIIDVENGNVFLELREEGKGTAGKIARMGVLTTATSFEVIAKNTHGQDVFRIKGGGVKQSCDYHDGSGNVMGKIKFASLRSFEALDVHSNVLMKTKSKWPALVATSHEVLQNTSAIGTIKQIDKSDAKEILSSNFDKINNYRKYDYSFHIQLITDVDDLHKALLLGTTYFLAHRSGMA